MSDKVKVQYMGKERDCEPISENIVKTGNAFLVKCSLKGTWHYCSPERMLKLAEKAGSREAVGMTYKSREGKAEEKNKELAILEKKMAAEKAAKEKEAVPAPLPVTPAAQPTKEVKKK